MHLSLHASAGHPHLRPHVASFARAPDVVVTWQALVACQDDTDDTPLATTGFYGCSFLSRPVALKAQCFHFTHSASFEQLFFFIMGQQHSIFTEEELDDYQELTFFTKSEIIVAYERFKQLAPDVVSKDRNAKLPMDKILNMPELGVNPFRDRICKVFSSSNDGHMTFEDFLDMMSVFSDKAPRSVKTEYAFQIFDFNEDDMISTEDLKQVIGRLTQRGGQVFADYEVKQLVENILKEADLDEDRLLAFAEFEHAISKAPDFMK
nr:calcium and integrin-binding family member 2-like [Rhipicephalus microplus]